MLVFGWLVWGGSFVRKKLLLAALLPAIPAAISLTTASAPAAADSCASLSGLSLSHAKIDSAQNIPAGNFSIPPARPGGRNQTYKDLPAFCRVAATLTPTPDSNIKIEVWMPAANWNGKFQAVGNGGWAGTISYEAMAKALRNGYATTSTDTGHTVGNGSFVEGHWEKLIDFLYRSEHEMTVRAKAIVAGYYGSAPKRSYWNGCSTGGRQGLMEATRYPSDFDGIVAGDPANPRSVHDSWDLSVTVAIHKDPAAVIPNEKFSTIHKAVIAACDKLDGVEDGLVTNPKACHFDVAALTCKGADNASCLTPAQVQSAKRLMSPAKADGVNFYPGLLPTSELGWGALAGPDANPRGADNFKYVIYKDAKWDWHSFDADKDLAAARKADELESVTTADLSAFTRHNGKIVFYHGWSDPQISPQGGIDYFEAVQKQTRNASSSTRLFMIPGMGHCRGGEGATDDFDAVASLDHWIETGEAPERISAAHMTGGKPVRTRPLCAYPQVARYKGTGSTDDEANFVCTAP